jgi:Tol biopolymer transport system component
VRPDLASSFGAPVQLAELTSGSEETSFMTTLDGKVGVMSSSRPGSSGFDLWQLSRASATGPFNAPTNDVYQNINSAANQLDPYLTPDGLRIYFAQSGGGQQLFMASRSSTTAMFSASVSLPDSGTHSTEADPELSPDELVLVYAANLPLSLFVATRSSTLQPFGAPAPLTQIIGTGYDGDPALSANGCELFYVSDRGGNRDLYRAIVNP